MQAYALTIQPAADRVITNGRFYTVNSLHRWAEAVAIQDGVFVYVGENAGTEAFVGPETQRHDLTGAMVLPGLVDAHTHPGLISIIGSDFDIPNNFPYPSQKESILTWLKGYATANPEQEMIVVGSWQVDMFGVAGPRKEDIDQVVSDRPVMLLDSSGHSSWVNSAFLKKFGIDENSPDPAPGVSFFVRDANGEPTGWLKEAAILPWFSASANAAPEHSQLVKQIEQVLNHYSRYGITLLLDAGNSGAEDKVYAAVAELDRSGRLPIRYEGSYHIRLPDQVPVAISELKRLRLQYGGERLQFNTIKIHFDGIHEVRTSAILEPYTDDPGNRGNTTISGEALKDFILELHVEGINLHLHTNSNRAARIALDAVESARNIVGGPLNTRVSTCHLELIHENDIPRFRHLDVPANFTLHWNGIGYLTGWEPTLGPERAKQRFLIQPLIDDGAVVSYSSDGTTIGGLYRTSPFFSMQIGHNRQEVGAKPESEILPPIEERLSLHDIVRGYTMGGAYQLGYEEKLGTIEVGKAADLVFLDRNLFQTDRYKISEITPTSVMLAGEVVQGKLK